MSDFEKDDLTTDEVANENEYVETVEVDADAIEEVNVVEPEISVTNDEASDVTVIEPEKDDNSLIINVEPEAVADNNKKSKKDKKKKKKGETEVDTEVVEVTNIPSEVVSSKENKKSKKLVSFISFTTIILALVCSIVDWVLASVTKNPEINLHLMQWIVIILYLTIAIKALPFIKGKKKWVKGMFWICVIATLVCILVPMIIDYVELSKLIQAKNSATTQSLMYMLA